MAKSIVTPELVEKINELYLKIGSYAGVSRELGGSPSPTTVKKYIIPNYISKENRKVKIFDKEISTIPPFEIFKNLDNWGELCILSEEEEKEIHILWEELSI